MSNAIESSTQQYPQSSLCSHCASAIPAGRSSAFCCAGCEAVYHTIISLGLTDYYSLRAKTGTAPRKPLTEVHQDFAFYNDPKFIELYSTPSSDGTALRSVTFFLAGIHCAACVWILEKLPELNSGVICSRVEFARNLLHVQYQSDATSLGAIASLLNSLGYFPAPIREGNESKLRKAAARTALLRIGVAAFCTMNIMMLAVSMYQGDITGIDARYSQLFAWVSLLLALPVVTFSALPFYRAALGGLRSGVLHIDLPIILAIAAGFGMSVLHTVNGTGGVYYDSICALILLLLSGRWIQQRSIEKVTDASNLLYALAPRTARVVDSDRDEFVESIPIGTQVRVAKGETIPVDGLVCSGDGYLSMALLTGESAPVHVSQGSRVFAGSPFNAGTITIKVEATGRDSRLGQLMQTLERASHQRAPLELFLDSVSRGFIAAVLVLAAATFWYWSGTNVTLAIEHAVALLVVSCPCVLALATPLTFSFAVSQAARKGILLKSAESIERLTKIKALYLDKTGTITSGEMSVTTIAFRNASGWKKISLPIADIDPVIDSALSNAQALERDSAHPIAAAIRRLKTCSREIQVAERRALSGIGVEGMIDSHQWKLVSPRKLKRDDLLGGALVQIRHEAAELGTSEAVLCCDEIPVLYFACSDTIRSDSEAAIRVLTNHLGLSVSILSGDSQNIVGALAQRLAIPAQLARGDLSPEEKQRIVAEREKYEPTAMVGDGVNDAPALSSCSVGIGVHGGAEICLTVADVFLANPGLRQLVALFEGAYRTMRVVKINLAISAAYNLVGATAAMMGLIGPLQAAILMPLSSLTVISISLFLRKF